MRTFFAIAALTAAASAVSVAGPYPVFNGSLDTMKSFEAYKNNVKTHLGSSTTLKNTARAAVRKYFDDKESAAKAATAQKEAEKVTVIRKKAYQRASEVLTGAEKRLVIFIKLLPRDKLSLRLSSKRLPTPLKKPKLMSTL